MFLEKGYYLVEDNHFCLYEQSKYKFAFELSGVSCAKLRCLHVLEIVNEHYYNLTDAFTFINSVQFIDGGVSSND